VVLTSDSRVLNVSLVRVASGGTVSLRNVTIADCQLSSAVSAVRVDGNVASAQNEVVSLVAVAIQAASDDGNGGQTSLLSSDGAQWRIDGARVVDVALASLLRFGSTDGAASVSIADVDVSSSSFERMFYNAWLGSSVGGSVSYSRVNVHGQCSFQSAFWDVAEQASWRHIGVAESVLRDDAIRWLGKNTRHALVTLSNITMRELTASAPVVPSDRPAGVLLLPYASAGAIELDSCQFGPFADARLEALQLAPIAANTRDALTFAWRGGSVLGLEASTPSVQLECVAEAQCAYRLADVRFERGRGAAVSLRSNGGTTTTAKVAFSVDRCVFESMHANSSGSATTAFGALEFSVQPTQRGDMLSATAKVSDCQFSRSSGFADAPLSFRVGGDEFVFNAVVATLAVDSCQFDGDAAPSGQLASSLYVGADAPVTVDISNVSFANQASPSVLCANEFNNAVRMKLSNVTFADSSVGGDDDSDYVPMASVEGLPQCTYQCASSLASVCPKHSHSPSDSNSLTWLWILIGIIAALFLLSSVAAFVYHRHRRKRRHSIDERVHLFSSGKDDDELLDDRHQYVTSLS
jgi:hypothetical protein